MKLREQIRARSRLRSARLRWTNRHRALPDFLILGAMKGGTTSLFAYLAALPGVIAPEVKELHYFSEKQNPNSYRVLGPGWYRSNFPLRSELRASGAITGEATPRYMVEPLAMSRISRDLPNSRWIVVLRDPSERALSHYGMFVAHEVEHLSASEAIADNLRAVVEDSGKVDPPSPTTLLIPEYVKRGHYTQQLSVIARLRPEVPTLVMFSENLFANNAESLSLLHSFLGLAEPERNEFTWLKRGEGKATLDPATREQLTTYFSAANAGLSDLLRSDQFLTINPDGWPDWVQRIHTTPETQRRELLDT